LEGQEEEKVGEEACKRKNEEGMNKHEHAVCAGIEE
jgi:hypothetical protein